MEKKTKFIIGGAIGLVAGYGAHKIIQARRVNKLIRDYDLNHNNDPLGLGVLYGNDKTRKRVKEK